MLDCNIHFLGTIRNMRLYCKFEQSKKTRYLTLRFYLGLLTRSSFNNQTHNRNRYRYFDKNSSAYNAVFWSDLIIIQNCYFRERTEYFNKLET